jgi:ABC-type uncharacterized transport system substrate-binding protein
MKRREFIALAAGAAALPLAARAQQAMPVIGFLSGASPGRQKDAFVRGLSDAGFVDGRNVIVEFHWAGGRYDQLPVIAADLVRRRVSVIAAFGGVHTAVAVKAVTSTIPIVFGMGSDPVKFGLVASLNRPGGNVTGVSFFTAELEAKRLGLLHQLVPGATAVGALVNPTNGNAANQTKELTEATRKLGLQLHVQHASVEQEFDAALAALADKRIQALQIASDPFFYAQRAKLVPLVARHAIPAIYEWREFVEAGGLMSYGTSLNDAYYQTAVYVARVLRGEKPADLPVMRTTKFELAINMKTAKALGLSVPNAMQLLADDVIE